MTMHETARLKPCQARTRHFTPRSTPRYDSNKKWLAESLEPGPETSLTVPCPNSGSTSCTSPAPDPRQARVTGGSSLKSKRYTCKTLMTMHETARLKPCQARTRHVTPRSTPRYDTTKGDSISFRGDEPDNTMSPHGKLRIYFLHLAC